jgi:hypothetical protein
MMQEFAHQAGGFEARPDRKFSEANPQFLLTPV